MENKRLVVLYIATSLDGFIAKHDGDIGFLAAVEKENEDYGYYEFIKSIDTVILGRKTYDKVLSFGIDFPHKDKDCYVITRTPRPSIDKITFYSVDLSPLIKKIRSQPGKNIFVDGGAEIVNELMKHNLIDEFIISIIPVFLGDGITLFKSGRPENNLQLVSSKSFEKGLAQLHYSRTK